METQKFEFFSNKFEIRILTFMKSWNHLSFVNISPTLVNDTSIERSSRLLHHGYSKIWIFFKKVRNSYLTFDEELKLPYLCQYQPYIGNWYINGKVIMSTTAWKHKKLDLKNSKLNFDLFFILTSKLNFDLCQRAEIIQVGLNMHLYDDIGDAMSSLRGSTSSLLIIICPFWW